VVNWNYVPAYIEAFEYRTSTNDGIVLGEGTDVSVQELPSRSTVPVRTA
jgi:hypothetical protein